MGTQMGGCWLRSALGWHISTYICQTRPIFALPKETYICSTKRNLYLLCQKRRIFGSAKGDVYSAQINHLPICLGWHISHWICQKRPIFAKRDLYLLYRRRVVTCVKSESESVWTCFKSERVSVVEFSTTTEICQKRPIFALKETYFPLPWRACLCVG